MINPRTLTNMKKALVQAIAVATLAILPATAQAVPIVGTLDLIGGVRVTADQIDWLPEGGGTGTALILGTSNGYFTALSGDTAIELDLTGLPVGVQIGTGVPGFQTFPGTDLPGLNFILDIIVSCGQSSMDPEDECVLGEDSAFRFDEDTEGTTVIMNFRGRVIDSNNPGEVSTFSAKYDATFTGLTPSEILDAITFQGFIETGYSARKITVAEPREVPEIPEPATLLTFGAGTALLAAARRRRAKK